MPLPWPVSTVLLTRRRLPTPPTAPAEVTPRDIASPPPADSRLVSCPTEVAEALIDALPRAPSAHAWAGSFNVFTRDHGEFIPALPGGRVAEGSAFLSPPEPVAVLAIVPTEVEEGTRGKTRPALDVLFLAAGHVAGAEGAAKTRKGAVPAHAAVWVSSDIVRQSWLSGVPRALLSDAVASFPLGLPGPVAFRSLPDPADPSFLDVALDAKEQDEAMESIIASASPRPTGAASPAAESPSPSPPVHPTPLRDASGARPALPSGPQPGNVGPRAGAGAGAGGAAGRSVTFAGASSSATRSTLADDATPPAASGELLPPPERRRRAPLGADAASEASAAPSGSPWGSVVPHFNSGSSTCSGGARKPSGFMITVQDGVETYVPARSGSSIFPGLAAAMAIHPEAVHVLDAGGTRAVARRLLFSYGGDGGDAIAAGALVENWCAAGLFLPDAHWRMFVPESFLLSLPDTDSAATTCALRAVRRAGSISELDKALEQAGVPFDSWGHPGAQAALLSFLSFLQNSFHPDSWISYFVHAIRPRSCSTNDPLARSANATVRADAAWRLFEDRADLADREADRGTGAPPEKPLPPRDLPDGIIVPRDLDLSYEALVRSLGAADAERRLAERLQAEARSSVADLRAEIRLLKAGKPSAMAASRRPKQSASRSPTSPAGGTAGRGGVRGFLAQFQPGLGELHRAEQAAGRAVTQFCYNFAQGNCRGVCPRTHVATSGIAADIAKHRAALPSPATAAAGPSSA